MACSEDVLLIVNNVRHKKMEGSIYMMGERLAWMPGTSNSFKISHNFADIRVQKISPDTKDKVQLQVVMHDNSANTFHFNNPMGREAQMKDRDAIKELLQRLLPQFKQKISSELEEKNRMLEQDPTLFQLYKDLVVSGVITSEEFWANRSLKNDKPENQKVGVSAAFLADIQPQADGCNGLRYSLNADIIHSIFRTYPTVKKLHASYVPDKLTESEFWTKFFQSHYFHRDRMNYSGNKDLFSECAKTDEQDIQKEISHSVNDPLIDLTKTQDTTLDEGYGAPQEDLRHQLNPVNLSLIRRFNHHSTMVLKSLSSATGESGTEQDNGATDTGSVNNTNGVATEPPPKKQKIIKEKIELDDLKVEEKSKHAGLNLSKMERYLSGPTPVMASRYTTSEDLIHAAQTAFNEIITWSPSLTGTLNHHQAISVLGELSPGGALMQGTSQHQLSHVPKDLLQELQQNYAALCELLRHFWTCFPTTTKFLEEKVGRMRENLERFRTTKMLPLHEKLNRHHYTSNMTSHMQELLTTAFTKYDNWQARRAGKR